MYLVCCYCGHTGLTQPVCLFLDEDQAASFVKTQETRWCRDWVDEDGDPRWRPHTPAEEEKTVRPTFRSVTFYVKPIVVARDILSILTVRNYWADEVHRDTPVFAYPTTTTLLKATANEEPDPTATDGSPSRGQAQCSLETDPA